MYANGLASSFHGIIGDAEQSRDQAAGLEGDQAGGEVGEIVRGADEIGRDVYRQRRRRQQEAQRLLRRRARDRAWGGALRMVDDYHNRDGRGILPLAEEAFPPAVFPRP